jgi:hypothetical protein
LTAIIYLTILLLPGTIAVGLASLQRHRFLFSLAISLALFVFSQLPFRVGGGALQNWLFVYAGLTVATWIGCGLAGRRWLTIFHKSPPHLSNPAAATSSFFATGVWLACLLVWGVAYWLMGPYTEVPSDFWNHLVRIRWELGRITAGELANYANNFPAFALLNREYMHGLHAGVWWVLGTNATEFTWESQLAVTLVFISAAFWFFYSQMLVNWSERKRALTAALATILTTAWMGTGDWAFVRYYATAPIMFTVPLLFLGVLIFVDYLKGIARSPAAAFFLLCAILALQALIHVQEAGLLLIFLFLTSIVARLQIRNSKADLWPKDSHHRIHTASQFFIMLAVVAVPILLMLVEPRSQHPGVILKPNTAIPLLRDLWIVDPSRQVWATITIGGLFSFFLLITSWRETRHFPYILAGALLPLVTVFNPIFIHLWERLLPVTLLWRFTMFLPASLLVAVAVGSLTERVAGHWKSVKLAMAALALFLLLPIPYSPSSLVVNRAFSFAPLKTRQSVEWLGDLVQFLETQPRQVIFTDPITSYVLRGLTSQILPGNKFYGHTSGIDFRQIAQEELLARFGDGLVVLNFRDGPDSKVTQALNHWDKKELMVTRFYPTGLRVNLDNQGFTLIWSNEKVFVYSHQSS